MSEQVDKLVDRISKQLGLGPKSISVAYDAGSKNPDYLAGRVLDNYEVLETFIDNIYGGFSKFLQTIDAVKVNLVTDSKFQTSVIVVPGKNKLDLVTEHSFKFIRQDTGIQFVRSYQPEYDSKRDLVSTQIIPHISWKSPENDYNTFSDMKQLDPSTVSKVEVANSFSQDFIMNAYKSAAFSVSVEKLLRIKDMF